MPPTSQQLARQQAAAKDRNLQASVNKGHPNSDAIKSFNKGEGAGQGEGGAQGLGAAAGAGKTENKPGNMAERHAQGPGGAGEHGNKVGGENHANKSGAENHANKQRNLQGNQAKAHSGKMAGPGGGAAHGPHQMTQRSGQPKMAAHGPQMGGKHPQMGGNRPRPTGQQQGKKKPDKP